MFLIPKSNTVNGGSLSILEKQLLFQEFDSKTQNGQWCFTTDIQKPMVCFNDFDSKQQNGQWLFKIDIQKPNVVYSLP